MKSSVTVTADRIVVEHLALTDPQLAAFLAEREEDERTELVERALRIGLMTICSAGVSLTTDVVRAEFARLTEDPGLQRSAGRHAGQALGAKGCGATGRLS